MHLNCNPVRSPHKRSALLQAAFTLMFALPLGIFPSAAHAAIANFEVVMKNDIKSHSCIRRFALI